MAHNNNAHYDMLWKVVVVGDSGVGKTNLLSQFVRNEFNPEFSSTIGVDFSVKTQKINGKDITLQIWDTAGQERYRSITRSYYRSAIGVVLVYDVSNDATFQHIEQWFQETRDSCNTDAKILLVGNKTDLERTVSTEQGKQFAEEKGILFIETSAKDSSSVETAFVKLLEELYHTVMEGKINEECLYRRRVCAAPPPRANGCC